MTEDEMGGWHHQLDEHEFEHRGYNMNHDVITIYLNFIFILCKA